VRPHGVVTGKGLSDLIREEFGLRITFVIMILLVAVNFTNVVTEFSGIAGSMQLFHVTKYISVPICALIVWALVVKGDYKSVEKIFLIASVFYIAYIIAGVLSRPDWHLAMVQTVKLPPRSVWSNKAYVYMTVGVIGTTITPWMQFYLQSSIVEKGVSVRQYKASRLDVIIGSIFTDLVAWFIMSPAPPRSMPTACATSPTLRRRRRHEAARRRLRLYPLRRRPLQCVPLRRVHSSALHRLHVCGLGFESGSDRGFREAKFFYWSTACSSLPALPWFLFQISRWSSSAFSRRY
jgi:hypothetical protein